MSGPKIRAVGILIKDNKILLIHRTRNGKEYWVFPGGGQEDGETVNEAVTREIEEEASVKCKADKLLYRHIYSDLGNQEHHFYLCEFISGTPKLGNFNEMQTMKEEDQTYEPVWAKVENLPKMLVYPLEIRDWLVKDYKTNFKKTPKVQTLSSEKLRQEV